MNKISIVIVSWNVKELLRDCLKSIYEQNLDEHIEVIVIDNASSDGTIDELAPEFPEALFINNPINLGFAGGNNLGIRLSHGEYILLLNPDTLLRPGSLLGMKSFMDTHPEAGGCGAYLLNPDNSLQYSCSPEPTLQSEFLRLFHLPGIRPDGYYEMADWDVSIPHRVDIILGACMFMRRSALEQSGLFDENYFMYSEEVDLCRRINQTGSKLYWVPSSQVLHIGGQSTRQVANKMFVQLYRAKIQFFRKHKGSMQARIYKFIVAASCLPRLGLFLLALLEPAKKSQNHKNTAINYYRLLQIIPSL